MKKINVLESVVGITDLSSSETFKICRKIITIKVFSLKNTIQSFLLSLNYQSYFLHATSKISKKKLKWQE